MSASIDKDPAARGEDARGILAGWLDDYIGGRCDRADMQASFLSVCRSNPEAPWDALALLDQYQRRGRIDAALVRALKADIAHLVFGVAHQAASGDGGETDDTDDVLEPPADARGLHDETSDDPVTTKTASREVDTAPAVRRPDTPHSRRTPRSGGPIVGDVLRKRYELLSIVGHGREGTVYKALDRHRSHLEESARFVAIKILKANHREHPETLAELEQEFHEARALSHPNIARVFDLDREDGFYYIVMDLLEGELLADVLRRLDGQPMQREYAFAMVADIGAALAYAHRQGIVHGNLKPGNVMLTRSGDVRVLNFGFARNRLLELHSTSQPHDPPIPAPAYASIERLGGARPDRGGDVYSLACMAYELLSGRHPFAGRPAVSARAHGRRPERIPGLTRRQWRALRRALSWTREARSIDVAELSAALGGAARSNLPVAPDRIAARPAAGRRWRMILPVMLIVVAAAAILSYLRLDSGTAIPEIIRDAVSRLPWPVRPAAEPSAAESTAAMRPASAGTDAAPKADSGTGGVQWPGTGDRAAAQAPEPGDRTRVAQAAKVVPAGPDTSAAALGDTQSRGEVQTSGEAQPQGEVQPRTVAAGPVSIGFDEDTYVVTESDTAAHLRVRRRGSAREPITFTWNLRGDSAEAGVDFANIGPVTERMPAGVREVTIAVPLVSDAIVENTELFLVEIESVQEGVSLAERSRATVIIVDDD